MPSSRSSRSRKRAAVLSEDRVTQLATRYLARQDRTAAQLGQFLLSKGASHSVIAKVLRRFQELGYVDDQVFARRWAEDRLRRHPMGTLRLRDELLAKGLSEQVVRETLRQVSPRGGEAGVARRLVADLRGRQPTVSPVRVIAALRGRGFDEDVIEDIVGCALDDAVDSTGANER